MKTENDWILTVVPVALLIATLGTKTFGQEWEQKYWAKSEAGRDQLKVTVATDVVSKYVWRGFDKFDDRAAVQPSVNLDWFGTGFSTKVWRSVPWSDGFVNSEEMRYVAAYSGSFWQDTPYATKYSANWIYYDFPNTFSQHKDAQELGARFSWPKLLTVSEGALVPNYYVGNLWPATSNAVNGDEGGWIHILGLAYDFTVYGIAVEQQLVRLSSEIVYNDGMGEGNVDQDWSHAVFSLSTRVEADKLVIRPAIHYQISMEETVNDEDELWYGLTISYGF